MTEPNTGLQPLPIAKGERRPPPEPPPVSADALQAERDLLHVGRMAREVLQLAKLPRHWWHQPDAHELVVAVLGWFSIERERVLRQRLQLRQLHAKVLQLKGIIAGLHETQAGLLTTIDRLQREREEYRRNR
jgi:hypothetical protein